MNKPYQSELEIASALAKQAGAEIMAIYLGTMETSLKSDHTPVTNADMKANELILQGIREHFPTDSIVSEELETIVGNNDRSWYLDPLDGTRGFTEHSDKFAVHIGLAKAGYPMLGIVYKPVTQELYYALRESGAYRQAPTGLKTRLRVNPEVAMENITVCVDKNLILEQY